jgi:hypothetical protein
MLVEKHNVDAALAALSGDFIDTRLCVSVQPEDEIFRFIVDNSELTINNWLFEPVPYAEFDAITSADGAVADTTTITLDGSHMEGGFDDDPDDILQRVLTYPLRDRPIQIGLLVINFETNEPIGLIPQFVGFIDNAPLMRERKPTSSNSKLLFNLVSFRAYAQRRVARLYSDTDHVSRFPLDRCARWISDVVFKLGKYSWNRDDAQGGGATTGGGGGATDNNRNFDHF